MKAVVFIFTGFVLLLANLWYIQGVYRTFFSSDPPDVVAPFLFVGRDDPQNVKGRALAQMLVSRLGSLQREISQAERALQEATHRRVPAPAPQRDAIHPVDNPREITLRTRVLEVPDIQVKVSGVEFSNILGWAYRSVAEGRAPSLPLLPREGQQVDHRRRPRNHGRRRHLDPGPGGGREGGSSRRSPTRSSGNS